MDLRLDRMDGFPAGLATVARADILRVLPNPALIRVAGRVDGPPLFVSTLLHGDEDASFHVLQALARAPAPPARPLLVFAGNVGATSANVRRRDDEPDWNRIWAGAPDASPHHALAAGVIAAARAVGVFASVDIHNNTGANPHYACVSALKPADLHLAALFSRVAVVYRNPPTTQSVAFSAFCPAVTLEAGRSGDAAGAAHALRLVEAALRLDHFPAHAPPPQDLALYETVGRLVVAADAVIRFGHAPADGDLVLPPDLDRLNFSDLPAGALLGHGAPGALRVADETGADVTDCFLEMRDGAIRLARPLTPSMLTTKEAAIRLDCLGYLMMRA